MDKTIDMAREAGLHIPYWGEEEDPKKDPPRWTMVSPLPPLLKAFEALVRADEREEFQRWFVGVITQHEQLILAEREACAKVCERMAGRPSWEAHQHYIDAAAAIRARGNT